MLNSSIYAVFERMWQHVLAKCNNYISVEAFNQHIESTNNPHNVTAEQIGINDILDIIQVEIDNHILDKDNPHGVTTEQIEALPIAGGALEGTLTVNGIVLTDGIDYGSGDPGDGVLGQLYFKKVT